MTVYQIRARYVAPTLAPDWREQLASRLGVRPRRLGLWAELGLYGALECLAMDSESTLAQNTVLVLSSQHGPALAMCSALAQAHDGLPMPLTFLQAQPGQLLATLSAQLRWCGDARFVTHRDPVAVLVLALAMAHTHADGILLGWVDEIQTPSSMWLRLQPAADPGGTWSTPEDFSSLLQHASHVRLGAARPEVIIGPTSVNADQVR